MISYTPYEYMLISAANAYGLDKMLFEERIAFMKYNQGNWHNLIPKAESPILFAKALNALDLVHQGKPTGYVMDLDATASGIQILSCLTGCLSSAVNVNLINPDVREDVYTIAVNHMNKYLSEEDKVSLTGLVTRDHVKQALMTVFYGSNAEPVKLLGDGTPQLKAFYKMLREVFTGVYELTNELVNAWQPYSAFHQWNLPDGHTAHIKVMQTKDVQIEVDELDHATFTHRILVNEGTEEGLSLVANVTHSVDGFLVREVTSRCNYNKEALLYAQRWLEKNTDTSVEVDNWDNVISINQVMSKTFFDLNNNDRIRLLILIQDLLDYTPFESATIHDSFWCSPLHMDRLRYWYISILAEIADSNLLAQIFSSIYGVDGTYEKLSDNLGDLIRSSNYPLS